MIEKIKPTTVEEYHNLAPAQAQEKLKQLCELLKAIAPHAIEELKWGKPVFIEQRILFSYSASKNYITFMPTAPSLAPFRDELSAYNCGQDTVQFPYSMPLPTGLIEKIARYRYNDVIQNDARWMY